MCKGRVCVLMMTLVLLCACSGGTGSGNEAEELALKIRSEYVAMEACKVQADFVADYGQRVYEFSVEAQTRGKDTTLTITAPSELAGMTIQLTGEDTALNYDGVTVETGPLDEDGLSPISALPTLLETARSGYITACSMETLDGQETVRVDCQSLDEETERQTTLWFDRNSHALLRGDITVDGLRVIQCQYDSFIPEE